MKPKRLFRFFLLLLVVFAVSAPAQKPPDTACPLAPPPPGCYYVFGPTYFDGNCDDYVLVCDGDS